MYWCIWCAGGFPDLQGTGLKKTDCRVISWCLALFAPVVDCLRRMTKNTKSNDFNGGHIVLRSFLCFCLHAAETEAETHDMERILHVRSCTSAEQIDKICWRSQTESR